MIASHILFNSRRGRKVAVVLFLGWYVTAVLHAVCEPFINHILTPELQRFRIFLPVKCCYLPRNARWQCVNIYLADNTTACVRFGNRKPTRQGIERRTGKKQGVQ